MIEKIIRIISNLKILSKINEIIDGLNTHTANKNNPHNVTAEQLGLATAYVYKGSVTNFSDLPTNAQNGWVYSVENEHTDSAGILHPAGANFAWNGSKWDDLGGSLSGYAKSVNSQSPDNKGNVNLTLVESLEKNTEDKLVVHNSDGSIQELEVGKKYTINNNPPDSNDNYDVGEFEGYWKSNESVSVGDVRFLKGRNNTKYVLECTQAGTTGTEQPVVNEDNIVANYTTNDRIGHMRMIFNLAEKDEDELIALGVAYNRITYSELWNYVQSRPNLVISEEEWQTKYTETNGKFVPYYSSGNGTTTFRTPLLSAYIKGTDSVDSVGGYLEAGLPNIEGLAGTIYGLFDGGRSSGALFNLNGNTTAYPYTPTSGTLAKDLNFNASKSNSIYGNSDTVQPETMQGIWVIKALGIVINSSETDIANLVQVVAELEEKVNSGSSTDTGNLLDLIHPIGSLYWSKNPTRPEELFGGTWTQIKDKFILAAGDNYEVGSVGGESEVSLTVEQMPEHSHNGSAASVGGHTHPIYAVGEYHPRSGGEGANNRSMYTSQTASSGSAGAHSHELTIDSTGSGVAHNNMPPYVTYYCWERTA